jgi:glucosamine-6-phosphate deaminase
LKRRLRACGDPKSASILQHHPNAKVFIDEPAAGRLQLTAYYRWVYDGKPDWQKDA